MSLLDQPALSMISYVDAAGLVEWAEKTGSNPAFFKDFLIHLAIVDEDIGWCGGTIAEKSCIEDSLF